MGGDGTTGGDEETEANGGSADETGDGGEGSASGGTSGSGSGPMLYGIDDWADVIDCPSPAECDVQAAFVDEVLSELSVLSADAIAVRPGRSATGHEGFVLVEVGPESFPAALGLRAGDVLWQVNDLPLRDLGDVMRAFEVLDQAATFTVQLDRRAQTLTRTYRRVARLGEP